MEHPLIYSPAHELLVCIIFENILSWLLIILIDDKKKLSYLATMFKQTLYYNTKNKWLY